MEVAVLADDTLWYNGRPLANGDELTSANFETYAVTIGPSGIVATLVRDSQSE